MTKNKDTKGSVVVGMSGGVDSSVAAFILKQQGFEVIGLHMKSSNSETAEDDEKSARLVAEKLGIDLAIIDYEDEMQQVKDYFIEEYKNGKTPNPCVLCNKVVKFNPFIEYAKKIGADYYATGHYAQIEHINNEHILYSGKDLPKDQSYFLNQLSVSQLEKVLFPLGGYSKLEVREIAEKIGFDNANRKDSYDVCFLGSEKFKNYIEKFIPEKSGNIVDISSGKIVGKHTGLSKYTIGQRKGLGIGGGFGKTLDAWFVSKKDLKTNTLYVEQGNGESLYSDTVLVKNFNWISNKPDSQIECLAKFRYRQDFQKVRVEPLSDGVVILCDEKQRAVTPGQFAVLYIQKEDKYKCLGGGKITALKRDGIELDL